MSLLIQKLPGYHLPLCPLYNGHGAEVYKYLKQCMIYKIILQDMLLAENQRGNPEY